MARLPGVEFVALIVGVMGCSASSPSIEPSADAPPDPGEVLRAGLEAPSCRCLVPCSYPQLSPLEACPGRFTHGGSANSRQLFLAIHTAWTQEQNHARRRRFEGAMFAGVPVG